MINDELTELGKKVIDYCTEYNIPIKFLFEILEDQKVTPMIRGKAMEYNAFLLLERTLPKVAWSVQKIELKVKTNFLL